ncbi:MAG TPA: dihydroorotate dehydrogenase electron transfer subunit [Tepidisphaeraceae bacterium]
MVTQRREQFVSRVAANIPLCREHYKLVLRLDAFPQTDPGQFIQVSCRDLDLDYSPETETDWRPGVVLDLKGQELMRPLAMLRRPFSLAGRRDLPSGPVELDLIHRVVGIGTSWLSQLEVGQRLHVLGPLGNRFELPPRRVLAIMVGGGVGIPPMIYLATRLAGQGAVAFSGALTRDLLPLTIRRDVPVPSADSFEPILSVEEFACHGIPAVISTDDGSYGFRGFITQALEKYLDAQHFDVPPVLYTCGPEPMMKRVAEIAASRGLECQVAVERAMACGMGTCQSCAIRVRKPDPALPPLVGRDWAYRLACTDGPVFRGADLLW